MKPLYVGLTTHPALLSYGQPPYPFGRREAEKNVAIEEEISVPSWPREWLFNRTREVVIDSDDGVPVRPCVHVW